MDTVTVDGKTYVKAAKAAALVGYTPDYIGQLCRKGAVGGIVLGKTWYVCEESLLDHKHSQTRVNTATTKRDVAKQRNALEMEVIARTPLSARFASRRHLLNTQIAYAPDTHDLLPVVAGQELPPVEDVSLSLDEGHVSEGGDFDGMPTDIDESEMSLYEATTDVGEGEKAHKDNFNENEYEIPIQIRKVADTPRRESSLARRAYRTHGLVSVSDAHSTEGKPSFDEGRRERIVIKPGRHTRAWYHPILVCVLFLLFLLANLVLEGTWTYIDKSSGHDQFQTTYNLASIHTIAEIFK